MSLTHEQFLAAVSGVSREQIRQAGQRYTPGVDPRAPNLRIASLFTAIENAACGAGAHARFQSVVDELSKAWEQAKHCSQRRRSLERRIAQARASLAPMITRLRARKVRAAEKWVERLAGLEADLMADIAYWRDKEDKLPAGGGQTSVSSERDKARRNVSAIARCLAVVREEKDFTDTAAFRVLYDPQLLVSGEWGTGKTHLMCDVTQHQLGRGQPTVLVLAKNFENHVVAEICGRIEAGRTVTEVFNRLEEAAGALGERVLVIVDGVNEGRRREWRQAVSTLRALVVDRPGIGLIITCRTPFESSAMTQDDLSKLHRVTHHGFDDQEFDAQAAFFQYYGLPLPEVPLLDSEFSRPLTLKLICQSLQDLTEKKLAAGFAGIASGQKGMTYVLESFVNRIGKPIEQAFGLSAKGCWGLLKGGDHISDRRRAGFAPCMAATLRAYVRPSEADRIIAANYPNMAPARRRHLLESLRTSGLLEEDAVWYASKSGYRARAVLRLPYQRFSDHLVARHLLKTYLDVSSVRAITRSFSSSSPLERIFRLASRQQQEYAQPGWAQALIAEFPERVGARLPSRRRELFFALPSKSRNASAYFGPFIEGLFWRSPEAFTEGTRLLLNQYLNSGQSAWERVVDALAAVSTKPKHPYHAGRLYDSLARYTMPDRDLSWSEYLRRRYASPTIHRLLTWAEKLDVARMTERSAEELVVLLSLVLTTVVRDDRDLATRALVLIGERFPEVLIKRVVASLGFNDPYLSERLLAAGYGVTLSLVDSEHASTFRPVLGAFANTLYRKMFAPRARYATHHTLKRDYALGIIELAQRARCVHLPRTADRNLTAPYPQTPSTFTSNGTPDAAVTEAIGHAIQMDFGNYTIGKLIPRRANYDDENPEYVKVRAKIERRIFDLGYRKERFEAPEREIGGMSFRARDEHKVDRYGKKYSWIAYFEMWGEREATRALPDWRLGERTPDCGVDPSFPKPPPEWTPPIPDLFGNPSIDTDTWVAGGFTPNWRSLLVVPEINGHVGDWVLVEGYVQGVDDDHDRELFAFLRGAFVERRDVRRVRGKFLSVEYPGNNKLPEGATEHYLFAAEAGRRTNYARHLLQRNGRYRRQMREAFERFATFPRRHRAHRGVDRVRSAAQSVEEDGSIRIEFFAPDLRMRRIPGIRVELPSIHFGWESYHSVHNSFSGFDLPAPSLIQRLGLASKNREIDFFDATGRPGTLYRAAGGGWGHNRHRLLYVRADLLRRYLRETRQTLVWFNWGERDWLRRAGGRSLAQDPVRQRIYQAYRHIHRSFSQWQE